MIKTVKKNKNDNGNINNIDDFNNDTSGNKMIMIILITMFMMNVSECFFFASTNGRNGINDN